MKKYSDEEINKALYLRKKERYSFAHLQKITGIPATTIRNWCGTNLKGSKWDTLLATNQRTRDALRLLDSPSVAVLESLQKDYAKIFVALLYWCEGAKYPSSNAVAFVNSDVGLVKIFVLLFRHAFVIEESKFRVYLQIHSNQDFKELKTYWSRQLTISEKQFMKPTVTNPNGRKHRIAYLGTCTVKYHDYRLLLRLMGIYEAFTKKIDTIL
ncbi:MAG: hypothetical protein Q7S76_01160 [bacterium]|nr:hypothetical protein [bacterium]